MRVAVGGMRILPVVVFIRGAVESLLEVVRWRIDCFELWQRSQRLSRFLLAHLEW